MWRNNVCEQQEQKHRTLNCRIRTEKYISDIPFVTYEYYQNNIKPKPQEVWKTEDGQTIWRCRICGYEKEHAKMWFKEFKKLHYMNFTTWSEMRLRDLVNTVCQFVRTLGKAFFI